MSSALRRLAGSACGLGDLPRAPGTWGSAATVVAVAALCGVAGLFDGPFAQAAGGTRLAVGAVAALAALLLGLWAGGHAERDFGAHDPPQFVLDEVVGQLIALLPLLAGGAALSPLGLLAAFALFRAFDILKPPPVGALEGLPGALGIMADDLAAGALAAGGVALLAAVGAFPR